MAANIETLIHVPLDESADLLLAVNEFLAKDCTRSLDELLVVQRRNVFLDSGVYWLSTQHALEHGVSMDEALSLAPEKVSHFDELFDCYVDTVRRYGEHLWGYIEIDQGGRENKKRTRARLEALGLAPIPVYHPLNDGWDYFDELASQYDRICLGNVVRSHGQQRKRLLATAWERRRKYPHLWIHALGLTPNETTIAYPMNSCDSSTWITNVRYAQHHTTSNAQSMGALAHGFIYSLSAGKFDERGHVKARKMSGYDAIMLGHTLRNIKSDFEVELGADVGMFADHHN
jgi:hypothetical protein